MTGVLKPPEVAMTLPRHRHDLSREAVRGSQRARILFATAEAVAAHGYADTSVGEITRRAGVSRKTFYELYADKEEAFLAAYAANDTVIARMTEAAAAYDEPREMLRAGIRAYLETLAEEPAFTHMLVIDAVGAGPRVLKRRAEAFREFVRVLATPLELAREGDPSLPEPDPTTLLAILGGINELVLQHLVEKDASTLPELAPAIEALVERVCFPPAAR
jgi:AcrR family transcriptional regulator